MSTSLSPAIQKMLAASNIVTVASMETGGNSCPRISLKKSKFTAKNGDDEVKLGEEIMVVILGINPAIGFSKTYYKDGYSPGSSEPPNCSSTNGVTPDPFGTPESQKCATCPQAVWGSAVSMSGGKAKACKDSKQLYVKLAEELDDPDAPTYLLIVTVLSLKPFGQYGKLLNSEGIPTPSLVITKLAFDEEASVPKLTFENVGLMDEKLIETSLAIADKRAWESIAAPAISAPVNKQKIDAPIESTAEVVDDGEDPTSQW